MCLITQGQDTSGCISFIWMITPLSAIKKEIVSHCHCYSSLTYIFGLVIKINKVRGNSIMISMLIFIDANGKYWDPQLA